MGGGRGRPPRRVPVPRPRGRGRPPRDGRAKPPSLAECFHFRCNQILERLKKKDHYNIFLEPVDPKVVTGYDKIVKNPMAISMIAKKLQETTYKSLGEFRRDLDLMWSNCLLFNGAEPINVFSKKAIELRKVTEKLIASTRADLEKDKEELHMWKERHRRNKPPGSNHASTHIADSGLLSTSVAPESGAANGNAHHLRTHNSTSPLPDNRVNPRAAYELALRQLLRNQYASNTGLHRKDEKESAQEHYIAPDGSVVPISSVRYNPNENHWDEEPALQKRRLDPVPDAIYNQLPRAWRQNMCSPLHHGDYVKVKDFVHSMQSFVKNAGGLSKKLVDEFLAPEYVMREDQEKRKRRKLEGNRSQMVMDSRKLSAEEGQRALKAALSDPLMSTCRLSFIPKLERSIPELDGEEGLHHFMPKQLVEEVKNVPLSVIDFASPHGVGAKVLEEVVRVMKMPGLGIDPAHVRCMEEIYSTAYEFASKQDPRAIAAFGSASTLSPNAIHELQVNMSRQAQSLAKVVSGGHSQVQQPQPPRQGYRDFQQYAGSFRQRSQAAMRGAVAGAGTQLPPIMGAAAQSVLPNELQDPAAAQRLQQQNLKSRARAHNAVHAYESMKISPSHHHSLPRPNGNAVRHGNAPSTLSSVLANSNALGATNATASSASAASVMPPLRNSMHMANITTSASVPMNLPGSNHNAQGTTPFYGGNSSQISKSVVPPGMSQSQAQVVCQNCGGLCTQGWRLGGSSGRQQLCTPCGMYWDMHKAHRPKHSLVERSRLAPMRQPGSLPNIASGQNGLSAAMRPVSLNPGRSSATQLRPLPSTISGIGGNNAARVASMGMIMNSLPQQQPTRKDFDTLSKQSSVLPVLRNDDLQRQQQQLAAQAKGAPNFAQHNQRNTNSVDALNNGVSNLSRNLQALTAHPPNSQPLSNRFGLMNSNALNNGNFRSSAKQEGMTAATASGSVGNQSSHFPSHSSQPMLPQLMSRIPQAQSRPELDASLHGSGGGGGSSSVARAMSVPSIAPIMFGDADTGNGQALSAPAPGTTPAQLDNIFSFDGDIQ